MATEKQIHSLVLDTGPIIRNHPTVSSLLAQSEELLTVPAIISEIRDSVTRSRVETTLLPFLTLRTPSDASFKFVSDFARRTGDYAVLSRVDLQIAALAYEVECERNGGDWRLRREPGQKRVNGAPPKSENQAHDGEAASITAEGTAEEYQAAKQLHDLDLKEDAPGFATPDNQHNDTPQDTTQPATGSIDRPELASDILTRYQGSTGDVQDPTEIKVDSAQDKPVDSAETTSSDDGESSDGGEWITPSNLKRRQAQDSASGSSTSAAPTKMQVATLTTDHALQNLLLQINLNLLSPGLTRITNLRTTLLRCHACFLLHREQNLQFCRRCGKPTLTRVTCTTTQSTGEFKVHLKKNMQWNNRGDRFSIPKPVHGSANGRVRGGGKEGWGNDLVLAPDQKEFVRAEERRKREEKGARGLMDDDYLPGILTGRREGRGGGRTKVGAGRNVNSKKR